MTNNAKKDRDKTESTRHFRRWRQNDATVIKPRGVSVCELSMSGCFQATAFPGSSLYFEKVREKTLGTRLVFELGERTKMGTLREPSWCRKWSDVDQDQLQISDRLTRACDLHLRDPRIWLDILSIQCYVNHLSEPLDLPALWGIVKVFEGTVRPWGWGISQDLHSCLDSSR